MLIPLTGYPKYANQVVPPSGDTTGAADTAAINAVAQGGKVALLRPGTYYVTNLLPGSLGGIAGVGPATILQAVSGTTGYQIALQTPASTHQVLLADFTLKPNTGSLGGIQLDNTGFTSGGGETDSLHTIDNVYVQGAGGDAFHLDNNIRSLRMTRCAAYSSGGYGCYVGTGCTDSSFTGCIMGVAALHAWDVAGWNNYFASCKGFYGGYSSGAFDTTHCGFEVTGKFNTFASCSAQTNALHGFDLNGCQACAFAGCEADTNGSGTGSGGVAFNINAATQCTVVGCTGGTSGSETQLYGLQVTGTNTATFLTMNTVTGIDGQFHYVSGGGYILIGTSTGDLSGLSSFKLPSGFEIGASGSQIYSGSGAPNISGSAAGSYYFRTDTPSTSDQRIYVATGTNTWTGIV